MERQEGGEGIAGEAVSAFAVMGDGGAQLFNGDGVSLVQQGGVFLLDFVRDADAQA